jgi:hypothetical protein
MLFFLFSILASTDVHLGKCDCVSLYNRGSHLFLRCLYSFLNFSGPEDGSSMIPRVSVTIYQSTRRHITEDSSRYYHRFKAMPRLTAKTRVRSQASPCGICDGQSGTGTCCSPSTYVSPVSIIPPVLCVY